MALKPVPLRGEPWSFIGWRVEKRARKKKNGEFLASLMESSYLCSVKLSQRYEKRRNQAIE